MPTFLDESGDTGHSPGSSRHFRLAAVWLPTATAAAFRADVQAARATLGLRADYEFKFHGTQHRPERRRAFLDAAGRTGFRFAVCSVAKVGHWAGVPKSALYYATTMTLAATFRPLYLTNEALAGARVPELVTVDENNDDTFLAAVNHAFHRLTSPAHGWNLTAPPRFASSHANPLLQLADFVCGAVSAHLDGRPEWYDLIAHRGEGPDTGHGPGVTCW